MITLSESSINQTSPYTISIESSNDTLTFLTGKGVLYRVGFCEDFSLGIPHVFQMYIENVCNVKSSFDEKIKQTITCILESFFLSKELTLFYVCDTKDGRQSARNRLFYRWFISYHNMKSYTLKNASTEVDGVHFYASILVHKQNPQHDFIVKSFDDFVVDFEQK